MPPPRKKRRVRFSKESPFPVPILSITGEAVGSEHWFYYTGDLCGTSIIVKHPGDMNFLYKMGFFGKGNLSRSQPDFSQRSLTANIPSPGDSVMIQPRIMSCRVYKNHEKWNLLEMGVKESCSSDSGLTDDDNEDCDNENLSVPSDYRLNNSEMLNHPQFDDSNPFMHSLNENDDTELLSEEQCFSSQNAASWEEDMWNDCESKDLRSEAEKSWDLIQGDHDFWSENSDLCQKEKKEFEEVITGQADTSVSYDKNIKTNSVSIVEQKPKHKENTTSDYSSHQTADSQPFENPQLFHNVSSENEFDKSNCDKNETVPEKSESDENHVHDISSVIENGQQSNNALFKESQNILLNSVSQNRLYPSKYSEDVTFLDPKCFDEVNGNVLVINDSDDEKVDPCKSRKLMWKPVVKKDVAPVTEHLQLNLEEAFFLSYGLGCLVIKNENKQLMNLSDLWCHFCKVQKTFLPNYIAYHYFRSKGWVPKSGLKFGCDLILYRGGPPFYHGSYSVIVRLVDEETLQDNSEYTMRNLSWISLSCLNRITEHVAKELIICYVIKGKDISSENLSSPSCIRSFSVQEVHVSRWISSQEREKKEEEEFP